MKARAKFITFEGMEGTGKTTLVRLVENHYRKQGVAIFASREPGGTWLGNRVRTLLLRKQKEEIDPRAELLLLEAARAQHVGLVLKEALAKHDLVLCDRFYDSTTAYQEVGRALNADFVNTANHFAAYGLTPDLTILLDMPRSVSLSRAFGRLARSKRPPEDRFEKESTRFHDKVRRAYLKIADREPDRFLIMDANRKPEEILESLIQTIDPLLPRKK